MLPRRASVLCLFPWFLIREGPCVVCRSVVGRVLRAQPAADDPQSIARPERSHRRPPPPVLPIIVSSPVSPHSSISLHSHSSRRTCTVQTREQHTSTHLDTHRRHPSPATRIAIFLASSSRL